MKFKTLIAVALLAATCAAPARADDDTPRWKQRAPIYNAYEVDDSRYSYNRYNRPGRSPNLNFNAADEDKDGTVSRTEIRRHLRDYEDTQQDRQNRRSARIATDQLKMKYDLADSDRNGKVTADEWENYRNHNSYTRRDNGRPDFYYRRNDHD